MFNKNDAIVNLGNKGYLSQVFNEISQNKKLNIVYLGGSITQGCNAETEEQRYVNISANWWSKNFPLAEISFFNAGIGATTSLYGVARADMHVLEKDPDLVFVEFSVNDDETMQFMESYESLVRKLLSHNSVKAVILVNNLFYNDGRNAQGIHNAVGLHYDLPIISVRDYIYPQIQAGYVDVNMLTDDMLHPNNIGHKMIAQLIENLLDQEYALFLKFGSFEKPKLPEKLTNCSYENLAVYNNTNFKPILNGFEADTHECNDFSNPFKNGWVASKRNSEITFKVKGSILMIQWRKTVNKPAPVAYVEVDGFKEKRIILDANFSENWGDLCCLTILEENARQCEHTIRIVIEQEGKNDSEFMVISIISTKF